MRMTPSVNNLTLLAKHFGAPISRIEQRRLPPLLLQQLVEACDLEPYDDRLLGLVLEIPAVNPRERRGQHAPLRRTVGLAVEHQVADVVDGLGVAVELGVQELGLVET